MPRQQNLQTITAVPWQGVLTNVGGQATVPENTVWEARNVELDSAGRLFKREGFRLWGQNLDSQAAAGLQYTELFDNVDQWAYSTTDTNSRIRGRNEYNRLIFESLDTVDGTYNVVYNRAAQANDGDVVDNNEAVVNLTWRSWGAMPAQSTTTTQAYGFAVHIRTDHAFTLTLLFLDDGIYYYNGTNFVTTSVGDIDDSKWHKIQVRITDASTGAFTIDIDDGNETSAALTATTYTQQTLAANQVAVSAYSNDNATYACELDMIQYRDGGTGDINPATVLNIFDWKSSKPVGSHLLVATRDVLYEDRNFEGFFTALMPTPAGDITFTPFGGELVIGSSAGPAYRWSGNRTPEPCPESMPNNVTAAASHQGRLYVATADDPLAFQFCDATSLTDPLDNWETSAVINGVETTAPNRFHIPDGRGRRITAMLGDFYGILLIWTENSLWMWRAGPDPFNDGILSKVSSNVGCIGPRAFDVIGRDVVFLNRDGVYTLSTVQEYGDISAAALSRSIRGLWQADNFNDQRKIIANKYSCVVHAANQSKTYISVQRGGQSSLNSLYSYNHATEQWAGPFEFDSSLTGATPAGGGLQAMAYAEVSIGQQRLMVGTNLGDVSYFGNDRRTDFISSRDADGSGYSVQLYIKTAKLDGRSINPHLTRKLKTWRTLRLFCLSRDASNIKVTYQAEGKDAATITKTSNPDNLDLIDSTFVIGISKLEDPERINVVHFMLDERSRWIEFIIEIDGDTDATDKNLAIVGYELDFVVDGEERTT
jgi:hypothetical protein